MSDRDWMLGVLSWDFYCAKRLEGEGMLGALLVNCLAS
jgi:hypothetical protein